MKKHIFRSLVLIFLVCTLMLSMTGCDTLDYRRAIELYNAGKFEAAGELFYELGDYEDSPALYKNCQYWTAALCRRLYGSSDTTAKISSRRPYRFLSRVCR